MRDGRRRLAMRLAAMFRRPKVDQLLAELSASQFNEWIAYLELEPHGPARGDLQAGIIAAVVANRFRKRSDKAIIPSDFLLKFDPEPEKPKQQSQEEMRRVLMDMVEVTAKRREILGETKEG